jgi:lantibiotic biosynthesis protein
MRIRLGCVSLASVLSPNPAAAPANAKRALYDATSLPLVVGRVPLLPLEVTTRVYGAEDPIEAAKQTFTTNGLARQALASSSPSLARAVNDWLVGKPLRNPKTPLRALAYLVRMASRPTPLGLCAGVGEVAVGDRTTLALDESGWQSFTRPDMGVMLKLAENVEQTARSAVAFVTNPCVFERGGRLYVVNTNLTSRVLDEGGNPLTEQRAITLKNTAAVRFTRALCTAPTPYDAIIEALAGEFQAPPDDASKLLDRLVEAGVVLSELRPSPFGDPAAYLHDRFVALGVPFAGALTAALGAARELDATPLPARDDRDYARLHDAFTALLPESSDNGIQIDLHAAFGGALGKQVVGDATRLAELYVRYGPVLALTKLQRRFEERYEGTGRMVPLMELVDQNVGLGIPDSHEIVERDTRERDSLLNRLACEAIRTLAPEVELDAGELNVLFPASKEEDRFPRALEIGFQVAASSAEALESGSYSIVPSGFIGSTGAAKALGRFAHMFGAEFFERARGIVRASCSPDQLVAELAFAPTDGRSYNVYIRPLLYDREVRVGIGGPASGGVIDAADLWVGLDESGFFLWSATHGQRVGIRETHLFATMTAAPNLCRFLSLLTMEGERAVVGFSWGPASNLTYRPRVRTGRIVLSPRSWSFARSELGKGAATARRCLQTWRERWAMPRYVLLVDFDQRLLVDLSSPVAAELILDQSKGETLLFHEALPAPDETWVKGSSGSHVVEFVASALCTRPEPPSTSRSESRVVTGRKRYGPGSAWTYARVYLGSQAIDDHLRSAIAPLVRDLRERGWIDRWFFLRYGDPQSHLRLRLRATAGFEAVVRERFLVAAEEWLANDRILRYALDTYDPEYERFGGVEKLEEVERLFEADSDACMAILDAAPGATDALVFAAVEAFDAAVRSFSAGHAARKVLGNFTRRKLSAEDRRALKALLLKHRAEGEQGREDSEPARLPKPAFEEYCGDLLHLHCNRLGLSGEAEARVGALLRALILARSEQTNIARRG